VKFRELVVYIAANFGDDPPLGDVKLNKVLHFSDFLAYNRLGHAITGARYKKEKKGPIAAPLKPAREQLVAERAVEVEFKWWPQLRHPQTITRALRQPADVFSDDERRIVALVMDELRSVTADETSELSHRRSPGRVLGAMSEDIPYDTALIPPAGPSDAALEAAREYAAQHGG
jgi:Protein of unknown function (DUF4065)